MILVGKTQVELDEEKSIQEKEEAKQGIKNRLSEIDTETIRPLRATLAGTQTEADTEKLLALEAEAAQLRANLKG